MERTSIYRVATNSSDNRLAYRSDSPFSKNLFWYTSAAGMRIHPKIVKDELLLLHFIRPFSVGEGGHEPEGCTKGRLML